MRRMLTALIAVPLAIIIYGCTTPATLTKMAITQERQADNIEKIAKLLEQQNSNVTNSQEKMVAAALLLAKYGTGNVSNQAIAILGYLGGVKAEKALLEMINNASSNRNSSYIINALVSMRSNKLRPVIIKLLNSENSQDINSAINAIQNRSLNILKKSDLPLLIKVLNEMPTDNNNSHRRNQIIRVLCQLDQDAGVNYICEELETANMNQQRELIYIPMNHGIRISTKSWMKIIKTLGEPDNQHISAFKALCDGISRNGDIRLIDATLEWADFAVQNSDFRSSYINLLNRMRDVKTAKVFLDLCLKNQQNNNYHKNYLKNFPGLIKKDGKYQLVDDETMGKLLKNRAKVIERLNKRDERRATKKKKKIKLKH